MKHARFAILAQQKPTQEMPSRNPFCVAKSIHSMGFYDAMCAVHCLPDMELTHQTFLLHYVLLGGIENCGLFTVILGFVLIEVLPL